MRILHVGKYYHPYRGGIENFTRDLCRSQAAAGHDVRALVHDEVRRGRTRSVEIERVVVVKAANLGELVYAPMSPTFGLHLARIERDFRPDILHLHMPNLSAAWLAARPPRAAFVVQWHSDVVPSEIEARLKFFYTFYKPMESRVLKLADAVAATSTDYQRHSEPLSRVTNKLGVIPLGLDPSRLDFPDKAPSYLPTGDFRATVLSVGRFTYYKGFEHLIRAAAKLEGVRVVIAGSGPLAGKLAGLARELGVADRVVMPGEVDDAELAALYRVGDVFCLPSVERTEAFGLVLLEAMSQGLPLVTTAVAGSGMNSVNEHGVTGVSVTPSDPEALAKALDSMLSDKAKLDEMAAACKQRFKELYHIDRVRERFDELYASLL